MDVEIPPGQVPGPVAVQRPPSRWHHKLASVLFSIFCFELGIFLVVFPWMEAWKTNYFSWISPVTLGQTWLAEFWRNLWLSPHFRGAISGLGLVNIYVSILEVFRLRRFSEPDS